MRSLALLAALAVVPVSVALIACGSTDSDAPGDPSGGSVIDGSPSTTDDARGATTDANAPADARGPVDDAGDAGAPLEDAATADADAAIVDSGPADAGPLSNDPFDPASCSGPLLTYAQASAMFTLGATTHVLGSYVVMHRTRTCGAVCGPWSEATQAYAAPPHNAVTGGFANVGSAQLEAPPTDPSDVTFTVRLIDASSSLAYPSGTTEFESLTASGTLLWPSSAYVYTALDNHFIPASPVPEPLPGPFVAVPLDVTLTTSCLRAASGEAADVTDQYALLVRF
jgi:hypothetical protein